MEFMPPIKNILCLFIAVKISKYKPDNCNIENRKLFGVFAREKWPVAAVTFPFFTVEFC